MIVARCSTASCDCSHARSACASTLRELRYTVFRGSVDLAHDNSRRFFGVRVADRRYEGLDLSGSEFHSCRLSRRTFHDCDFREARFCLVFADYCRFERCTFAAMHATESVFAGSTFEHCTTVGATADRCNFNAVRATDCDFSDTSFRGSRDLYEVLFDFSERREVSFKSSNVADAQFS